MKAKLLKAQARKKKFLKRKKIIQGDEDSDLSMSSDDEESFSENIVGKLVNSKYLIVKYLGRGAFSKVWLVLDIGKNKYYALKIQESKYNEDMDEEIKLITKLQKRINIDTDDLSSYRFGIMVENFSERINDNICRCMVLELLGESVIKLCYSENDKYLTTGIIKRIIKDILIGLKNIHELGIIHTDMKTDNILLTQNSQEIEDYIEKIKALEISKIYEEVFTNYIPSEIGLLEKNKRKMIKRKIRNKTLKEIAKRFKSEIIDINGSEIENNLELKIEELRDEDLEIEDDIETLGENGMENMDWENIGVKIIDFGNSEFIHEKHQDEIYTRSYRPPENIVNNEYSTKSDIWFIGCFLYELLTGNVLFEIDVVDNKDFLKDKIHLLQMQSILGKMPRDMSMNCEFSEDLFDLKGKILKNKYLKNLNLEDRNLREELESRIEIEENELDLIEDLIYKILEYDPNVRLDSSSILKHKWFQ